MSLVSVCFLQCLPSSQSILFFYYPRQDKSPMPGFKETGLSKRLQSGNDGQDLSERVPPPRSSSPVIGSPPVRVVPIGTPPKQPVSHTMNHQVRRTQYFTKDDNYGLQGTQAWCTEQFPVSSPMSASAYVPFLFYLFELKMLFLYIGFTVSLSLVLSLSCLPLLVLLYPAGFQQDSSSL